MSLRSWLADCQRRTRRFFGLFRVPQSARKRIARIPFRTEQLEQRCLLTIIDLAELGAAGTTLFGIDVFDAAGGSVSGVGDVNGDGYDDFMIGTETGDGVNNSNFASGESYLIFGGPTIPATIDLANLGSVGVTIYPEGAGGRFGKSVSGAGDVNGDGFDDLIIGAETASGPSNYQTLSGVSYVIYGRTTFPSTLDLTVPGWNGITIVGDDNGFSGSAVSSAGDVNGDGYDDVIIVDHFGGVFGIGEVVFGGPALPAVIQLSDLGSGGITISNTGGNFWSQPSGSGAGDVNGDGFADMVFVVEVEIGVREHAIVFGGSTLPTAIDLTNLGAAGVRIIDEPSGSSFGSAVARAGDVNGDGFDDIAIAVDAVDGPNGELFIGKNYIIYGSVAIPGTIDLANLGSAGITLLNPLTTSGISTSISGAGDVNADGFDDFIIGLSRADGLSNDRFVSGESYVFFGGPVLPNVINVGAENSAGIIISGADVFDFSGSSVANAGDINGDGFADLLVGAPSAAGLNNAATFTGEAYLLYGKNLTNSVSHLGSSTGETLTGNAGANVMNGAAGDDTLIGNGGADVIYGGNGNDVIAITDTTFRRVDGGNGSDLLRIDGSGWTLDLTTLADNRLTNIESIDLRGSGPNTLTLDLQEVLNLTANSNPQHTSNTLTIRRDKNDVVNIGSGWTAIESETINSELYSVYIQGAAILKVTNLEALNQRPIFTSSATPTVAENQTFAITVLATDSDVPAETVTYAITGGVDRAKFSITIDGQLSFITPPNFEMPTDVGANNIYNLQVTANDGNGGLTSQSLSVQVTAVNDNSPVFTSPTTFNTPDGTTAAGLAVAIDADLPAQTITYTITGGADQSKFVISSNGVLTFVTAPTPVAPTDADLNNIYEVQVTANDGNGRQTVQSISVTATPVNRFSPVFSSPSAFTIAENIANVGVIVATDADLPAQTISYSVTGGLDRLKFNISSGGVLSFVALPDYESPSDVGTNNVYDLQVTASDGNGGLTSQFVTVTILPVNDIAPVFGTPATITIAENSTTVRTIVANDADLPAQTINYSISGGADQARFNISAAGALTFVSPPDFENPVDEGGNNVYNVQITANDGSGNPVMRNFAINVANVDEVPPTVFFGTVTPNPRNSRVDILAIDFDELVEGFGLNDLSLTRDGGPNLLNGSQTLVSLRNSSFFLTGLAALTSTAGVYTLTLNPSGSGVSDEAGNLLVTGGSRSWTLDTSYPTATITPVTPDPRATAVSSMTIVFSEAITGFGLNDLSLTRNSGANLLTGSETLTTSDNMTYTLSDLSGLTASLGNYSLKLFAPTSGIQDHVGNILSGDATELWTRVNTSVSTSITLSLDNATIPEAGGVATITATLSALVESDVTITFGFSGTTAFPADYSRSATQLVIPAGTSNGTLILTAVSDGNVETTETLIVDITGVTNGTENGAQQVTTRILDDDHSPVFSSPASVSVTENVIVAITVSATDVDLPAQAVTFSIVGGLDQALFTMTPGGQLSFRTAPNFELPIDAGANNVYNVQIRADDGHNGVTLQNLAITITDINENPPTVTIQPVTPDPRTTSVNTVQIVFNEAVTGFDLNDLTLTRNGRGNLLTGAETLTTANNITFTLGGVSGLTAAEGSYALSVNAVGSGVANSAGFFLAVGTVENWSLDLTEPTVSIDAILPNPRTIEVNSMSIVFNESILGLGLNDLVLTRDGGPNLLTGSVALETADNTHFTLGNLAALTRVNGTYTLSLNASGSGIQDVVGNPLVQSANVSWTRISPTVSLAVNESSIAESGAAIVTATLSSATDVDVTVELSFNGLAASPADYLRSSTQIVIPAGSTTGTMTLTSVQDAEFESAEPIVAEITQVTNAIEEDVQHIATQIVNDDNAPVFTSTATPSTPENVTVVMLIVATDADAPSQTISYSITGGLDQGRFAITPNGNLSFLSAPDFEAPADSDQNNGYQIQVTANDGHGGVTVQNLIVTVTNVAEGPQLLLGGSAVTWINRQAPAVILPQLTVGSGVNLVGGKLTISVNAVGTAKKLTDKFALPMSTGFGSTTTQFASGRLTIQIQLNQSSNSSNIQSFLRGLTFATKGPGFKILTRKMDITLANAEGLNSTVSQTINVRKKP